MRVGVFTNNYLPFRGGVTTAVETLRRGLEGLGHSVWVFAPAWRGPHADPAFVFRYPSAPAPTYPGFAIPLPFSRRLSRAARELELDTVPAQHPLLLGVTARRLAGAEGRPLVFTYHARYEKYAHYVPLPERLVAAAAVRLASRFADSADLVVAPSARIAESRAAGGVKSPIATVPTGVPLDLFGPGDRGAARRGLGLPADVPLCLYVGRLDREKNVERVIDAFASIAGAVSEARLLLVGQGSHETALKRLAAASPARGAIDFMGSVVREELPPYYRAADLFLFSSETETQGLVLAEAHACALPAVAVRASGVDEVVRDGETGLLTKSDAQDLADAAIGLLLDADRRLGMGRAARELAERDFSAMRQVEVMAGLYRPLLSARS